MTKRCGISWMLATALVVLLAGTANAEPSSSLIVEGPQVAQTEQRTDIVGNYSYMRNRQNGYDPRYQFPNTVYQDEYPTQPGQVMTPAGPNDPRFQARYQYRYNPNVNGNVYYNPNNPYVRGSDGYYYNPNNTRVVRDANGNVIQRNGRRVITIGR